MKNTCLGEHSVAVENLPIHTDQKNVSPENDPAHFDMSFDGNVKRMCDDCREVRRFAISWEDFEIYSTKKPELRQQARDIIYDLLGYEPPLPIMIPDEVYLREAIGYYGTLDGYSKEMFDQDVYRIVQRIRNKDMHKGWGEKSGFDAHDHENYNTYLMPYIRPARDRLARFLGYYPDLKYSLEAELLLREFIASDIFNLAWSEAAFDFKAITIVKYREVLLNEGQEAADASPLIPAKPYG